MGQYLLLITPKRYSEGFYGIVGYFGVYAVKVLLSPLLEGGAGDAAHFGCSLDEVGVAVTPLGFL